jgi:hypothetical protein
MLHSARFGFYDMADSFNPRYGLPILTGDNYHYWAIAIRTYLEEERLWTIVTGERNLANPSRYYYGGDPGNASPAYEDPEYDFKLDDATVRSMLLNCVSNAQLIHFIHRSTAREMWEALRHAHDNPGGNRTLRLIGDFLNFEAGKRTVDEAAAALDRLEARIRAAAPHQVPPENWKTKKLIDAMGPRFDFVNQILCDGKDLSYADAVARLKEEEQLLARRTSRSQHLYVASTAGPPRKFQGKCYSCGKTGHRMEDCRAAEANEAAARQP